MALQTPSADPSESPARPRHAAAAGRAAAVPAVRLEGVTKAFGDVVAVDGIDLDVRDGEFFSMLGPSGSGKTTTLRMIAGFELPTAGRILLHGQDVSRQPPFERDVNTVFQDYALFPHMTRRRQRRLRPRRQEGARATSGRGASPTRSGWSAWRATTGASRASCRAASGSASRSPARS